MAARTIASSSLIVVVAPSGLLLLHQVPILWLVSTGRLNKILSSQDITDLWEKKKELYKLNTMRINKLISFLEYHLQLAN
jgi:hypothetical protein